MIDPWFNIEVAPWFSLLALFSLLAYLDPLAMKGRYRRSVLGAYYGGAGFGALVFIVGLVAWFAGQPQWVWSALMLSGALTFGLLLHATLKVHKLYQTAELRKSIAQDL